jgi:hypothetical protein
MYMRRTLSGGFRRAILAATAFEPQIADEPRRGSLRLVLEQYAAAVPGFFL